MTRWLVAGSVVLLAIVGAVVVVVTQGSPSHSATRDAVALTSSARHQFADVGALVGASDLVVVGRAIADEDGAPSGTRVPRTRTRRRRSGRTS